MLDDVKDSWNNLGGNDAVVSFEKRWCEWSVDETTQWFAFLLDTKSVDIYGDDDYEIEDYSSSTSNSGDENDNDEEDDEKKQETNEVLVDFKHVESVLYGMDFNAKKYFPVLLKPFQFKTFGFGNKQDRKLLCKKTKALIEKYPRKSKSNKKYQKSKEKNNNNINNNEYNLEGFVQHTN